MSLNFLPLEIRVGLEDKIGIVATSSPTTVKVKGTDIRNNLKEWKLISTFTYQLESLEVQKTLPP